MTKGARSLALVVVALLVGPARAYASDAACASAQRRLLELGTLAHCRFTLAIGAGYGYTEAVLNGGDGHHRAQAVAQGEFAPRADLAFGLRLAGRYDRHLGVPVRPGASGTDDGWTGEPRLTGRYERRLGASDVLGVALGINLPGGAAPSIEPRAVGGDVALLATHTRGAWALDGLLGFRLDRSAAALPPRDRLSPGDRVGLGSNEADALLIGVGAVRRGPYDLFADVTIEALLGARAPRAAAWPVHVTLGARRPLTAQLLGEVMLDVVPSARPDLRAGTPLVDVPPRVSLLIGLVYARAGAPVAPAPSPAPPATQMQPQPAAPPATAAAPAPPTAARGQLRGSIRSYGGRGLVATIHIAPLGKGGPEAPAKPPSAAPATPEDSEQTLQTRTGEFELELPPGAYEVLVESTGYIPQRRRITIDPDGVTLLNADLRRSR